MTRFLRWLIPALLAAVTVGCQPPPADVTTVVGDSLTMTTLLDGQFPAGWDIHSMLGWQSEDAQPGVTARTADPARSPCAAAIALGHNDAVKHSDGRGDGWTATDATQMRRLRDTFHPDTRVLWVLPDYTGTDPVYRASIETFRSWVRAEALRHGDLVADWRTAHVAADIDPDGAHLTPTGRRAYGALITQEMPDCG